MTLLKKLLPPLFTVLLVAAAALLPPSLSRLRDVLTLQGVHAEEITAFSSSSGLSTLEKISLLCNGREEFSNFIQSRQDFGVSRNQDILAMAQRELGRLKDMGIVPIHVDENGLDIKSVMMATYTDPADLSRSVSVWEAFFLEEDWNLAVLLDTETEKILELTCEAPSDSSSYSVALDGEEDGLASPSPVPNVPGSVPDSAVKRLEEYAAYLGVSLNSFDAVIESVCYRASVTNTDLYYYLSQDGEFFYSLSLKGRP